ncbi:MAG: phosphodiester glycosidase family protein [Bacillota bacterium]
MFLKQKKFVAFVVLVLVIESFLSYNVQASGNIVEEFKASEGVNYKDYRTVVSNNNQAVRVLEMNLTDPYTKVDVGIPNPLNKISRTTLQAIEATRSEHQVVGAVNGSFFNQDTLPMYLISYRNKLVNAGIIASGEDQYVNEPIAFGIDAEGKGRIEHYNLDLSFAHKGTSYSITSTNKQRSDNSLILYTPDFPGGYTDTNAYGMEIVVSNLDAPLDLEFGSTVTGKVEGIRRHGDATNTKIPDNGFVLSAHGDALGTVKNMVIGDSISLSVDIDSQWENAGFMLAGGPLLVDGGQVSLSMDPTSSRARERAPRTAVAIDSTRGKAFFITVDGRQPGYSTGMSLPEFASYLKGLGVDTALNLDGGGSTTMAARYPGDSQVKLINKPSDGWERPISTTLMAISTAPKGIPTYLFGEKSANGSLLKGASVKVNLDYVLDQFYNPITLSQSNAKLVDNQGLGNINGMTFTAAKAGEGTLSLQYGTAIKNLPINVVDQLGKLSLSPGSVSARVGQSIQINASGQDKNNQPVIMNNDSVEWSVTGNIGTISSNGLFEATQAGGAGTITATYGSIKASIPVTIGGGVKALDTLETGDNWTTSSVRGNGTINSVSTPVYEGTQSLKWDYSFTKDQSGTAAVYLDAKTPIDLNGIPNEIGFRLFGDAKQQWVRGKVVDGNGTEHTIDFTEEKGLTWSGWKYVNAPIDSSWKTPLTLKQIYLAQPYEELKTSGTIYIDDLKAVYSDTHQEPLFKDTGLSYRAEKEVGSLVDKGIISGYPDGYFQPGTTLNRVQAAILLARALDLDISSQEVPGFSDIPETYRFHNEIAAVANASIMKGKQGGEVFDPYTKLTRAEMAVVLQRAYELPNSSENPFSDNYNNSFAFEAVKALAASGITEGFTDGTFRPANPISRTDFSVFLYRALNK